MILDALNFSDEFVPGTIDWNLQGWVTIKPWKTRCRM